VCVWCVCGVCVWCVCGVCVVCVWCVCGVRARANRWFYKLNEQQHNVSIRNHKINHSDIHSNFMT